MTLPTLPGVSERNRTIALLGAIAVVLLVLTALAYALLAGRPIDKLLPTLAGFATPTIVSLLTAAGIRQQTDRLAKEVGEVHDKVNGNYSVMEQRNADLTDRLSVMPSAAASTRPLTPNTPYRIDNTSGRHRR